MFRPDGSAGGTRARVKSIRGGMGIGDALYLQAVVRHLVAQGQRLEVCTAWPDIFRPHAGRIEIAGFRRNPIDILAHYSRRRHYPTTQFADVCLEAGLREPCELVLDWEITDQAFVDPLLERGLPIVCVQLPRAPMNRTDGIGTELLPDCRVIQQQIDALRGRVLLVQIGAGRPLFEFKGIDVDLAGKTTVAQMLDVASLAAGFVGYVSFIVPLAESLKKPALLTWSRLGFKSPTAFVRQITPKKICERDTSICVVDNATFDEMRAAREAFENAIRLTR